MSGEAKRATHRKPSLSEVCLLASTCKAIDVQSSCICVVAAAAAVVVVAAYR